MDKYQVGLLARSNNTLIEAMGMLAENQLRLSKGESIVYGHEAFCNLIERGGANENDIRTALTD